MDWDARALQKSYLLNVQLLRAMTTFLRGRCATASAGATAAHRRRRLAEARRMAVQLEREGMPWIAPLASIVSAGVASESGDRSSAIASLRATIERAAIADMPTHAAAARYQLGSLLGGDEGAKLLGGARDEMTGQGIRAPARMAAMLIPGRWTSR